MNIDRSTHLRSDADGLQAIGVKDTSVVDVLHAVRHADEQAGEGGASARAGARVLLALLVVSAEDAVDVAAVADVDDAAAGGAVALRQAVLAHHHHATHDQDADADDGNRQQDAVARLGADVRDRLFRHGARRRLSRDQQTHTRAPALPPLTTRSPINRITLRSQPAARLVGRHVRRSAGDVSRTAAPSHDNSLTRLAWQRHSRSIMSAPQAIVARNMS